MIYTLAIVGVIIVVIFWWRWTSVKRGARQRDEKLLRFLDPIAQKLSKKDPVTPEEVACLSRQPQYRPMLYHMLTHFERLDLFPSEHLAVQAQGAGALAYWLMHPNEARDAPSEIILLEEVSRELRGKQVKFLVFRYQMPAAQWAEQDGWQVGLAGPFIDNDAPYSGLASAFSRGDKYGEVKPTELVDWFIAMLTRKGATI